MELIKNTRVTFHPVGHIYKLDGKKRLIGVTSLMKKYGLRSTTPTSPRTC